MKRSHEDTLYIGALEDMVVMLSERQPNPGIEVCTTKGCQRVCHWDIDDSSDDLDGGLAERKCHYCKRGPDQCDPLCIVCYPLPLPQCNKCNQRYCANCALDDGSGWCGLCDVDE
jgi:hypothetical protein